jgi:alkylation response protein AidB-like acyl-CoA dehydrogenase
VDFLPTDDQVALTGGVREFLEREFPVDRLFAVTNGIDDELWRGLDELGVFTLRRPENEGGLGLRLADAALVFVELGAVCAPGPIVASHLAATHLVGTDAGVGSGDVVTVLDPTWHPLLVGHLEAASAVVVVRDDSLQVVRPAELQLDPVASPMDPLTPLHEVTDYPAGATFGGAEDALRWRLEGAVLTAAFQVGLARRLTELAVSYSVQREQFGRVIAKFQAVKHMCADMHARAELAQAAVDAAAVTMDYPEVGDPARAVAGAKLLANDAASSNARSAIQVYGGMGITWDVPVHFFLKRAWMLAADWGTSEEHAEALAELL